MSDPSARQRGSRRRPEPAPAPRRGGRPSRPGARAARPSTRPAPERKGHASPTRRPGAWLSPILLKGLLAVAFTGLIVLAGLLAVHITDPQRFSDGTADAAMVNPPEGHNRVQPDVFHAQEHLELFDPLAERDPEAEALGEERVFSAAEDLELDDLELHLQESDATEACGDVVWGELLGQALAEGECTSAVRGVYTDDAEDYVAQFTLFDLADSSHAQEAMEAMAPETDPAFVVAVPSSHVGLHDGYSQATAQVMGHYLAVFWAARTDGETPEEDDSLAGVNVAVMDAASEVYRELSAAAE